MTTSSCVKWRCKFYQTTTNGYIFIIMCYMKYTHGLYEDVDEQQRINDYIFMCYIKYAHVLHENVDE